MSFLTACSLLILCHSLFEVVIKDIIERNHIEKIQELNDLINVLASGIGSLSNPSKIAATFKSVIQSNISLNTKGRKYIGTPVKYYFEDVGLRNARLGFRQIEETHLMENIIYNELKIMEYSVDIGVVQKRARAKTVLFRINSSK